MSAVNQLEKSMLFDRVSESETKLLMERFQQMSLGAGEFVFKENESGDTLYIVEKGAVSMKTRITGDIEKTLFTADESNVFGEFSFMDGGNRSASAVAEEDVDLLSLNRNDFDNFIQENPETGTKLLNNLLCIVVERLRITNEAYRDAVRWGLELTGTQSLNFHYLITEDVEVTIELVSNRTFTGKVIQLDRSEAGYQVILIDKAGQIVIIPYHAVVSVSVAQ